MENRSTAPLFLEFADPRSAVCYSWDARRLRKTEALTLASSIPWEMSNTEQTELWMRCIKTMRRASSHSPPPLAMPSYPRAARRTFASSRREMRGGGALALACDVLPLTVDTRLRDAATTAARKLASSYYSLPHR